MVGWVDGKENLIIGEKGPVEGDAILDYWKGKGSVYVEDDIGGSLTINKAKIGGGIYANGVKIDGKIYLNRTKVSEWIYAKNAKIDEKIDIHKSNIGGWISADGVETGLINIEYAKIGGSIDVDALDDPGSYLSLILPFSS